MKAPTICVDSEGKTTIHTMKCMYMVLYMCINLHCMQMEKSACIFYIGIVIIIND